jgi:hypothetical protein
VTRRVVHCNHRRTSTGSKRCRGRQRLVVQKDIVHFRPAKRPPQGRRQRQSGQHHLVVTMNIKAMVWRHFGRVINRILLPFAVGQCLNLHCSRWRMIADQALRRWRSCPIKDGRILRLMAGGKGHFKVGSLGYTLDRLVRVGKVRGHLVGHRATRQVRKPRPPRRAVFAQGTHSRRRRRSS